MGFLDKAKTKASHLAEQAKEKIDDVKEKRKVDDLLDDLGRIVYRQRNIWEDDGARSLLRSAIGCETVPTVLVGDTVLVNPSADEAVAGLALVAPEQVPGDYEPTRPGPIGRLVRRALAGEPHELATEA